VQRATFIYRLHRNDGRKTAPTFIQLMIIKGEKKVVVDIADDTKVNR